MPSSATARRQRRSRRGSLTVEMILVVVVLAIVTVAIVQFGLFFANAQVVSLAARSGGLAASQTCDLPDCEGPVPENIIRTIRHQLASSGIDWSHIRLEHNVTTHHDIVALTSQQGDYEAASKSHLDCPPAEGTHFVRVTVCVPLGEVFPKQLSFFGEQLFPHSRTYEHTAVFRYERRHLHCHCEHGHHHGHHHHGDHET
jgi:hypothetical protein